MGDRSVSDVKTSTRRVKDIASSIDSDQGCRLTLVEECPDIRAGVADRIH